MNKTWIEKAGTIIGLVVFVSAMVFLDFPTGCGNIRVAGVSPNWSEKFKEGAITYVVSKNGYVCEERVLTEKDAKFYRILARKRAEGLRLDLMKNNGYTYFVFSGDQTTQLNGGKIAFTFDLETCERLAKDLEDMDAR